MTTKPFSPESFQTFGDLLKYLRRRERLTQLELSIAVGYSETQIGKLEKNQRRPDLTAIKALFIPALHLEEEPGLIARFLELAQSTRQEDAPAPGYAPYKGLLFFDEVDADLFFGRETLTAHLAERIAGLALDRSTRLLAIVGASGSGKSSLVRAGLAVALKKAGWNVHVFTPGANPLKTLETQLDLNPSSAESDCVLVLVDQCEEVFTLCRDESERVLFIEKLLTLAQKSSKKITVVIALRADFYSHCAQYPALRNAVAAQQEYIGQMSAHELRRAIEEPAKRGGWDFEPGLVNVLLQDIGVHGSSEPEPGALPLLSHALLATWERRRGRTFTLDGYHAIGGVRGAIAETAESVFTDQLNGQQQELAREVFLRLTELGEGTEDTRRRAALNELVRQSSEATQLRAVLNTLADARLITLNEDSAEVAHEALIREWQRLHEWLTNDRDSLRLHRHLTDSAHEWEARGRDTSELYRGARLAQAREWAQPSEERLNESERAFLKVSIEQEERDALEREAQRQRELEAAQKLTETERQRAEEQAHAATRLRRRAVFLGASFVLAIVLAGFALFFSNQAHQKATEAEQQRSAAVDAQATAQAERDRADETAKISFSRELAVQSKLNLNVDTERSVLLALSAYNTARTKEAVDALHEAVLSSRVLMTLNAGTGVINDVAFSPDGKRFASASDDHTAKIWDTATGKELFNLTSHTDAVTTVWFSPNGRQLASGSADGSVKLWDTSSGKLLLTINVGVPVSTVQFGPDGQWIATGAAESKVRFWDTSSGQELFELTDSDWNTSSRALLVTAISMSRDGKRLAIALHTQDDEFGRVELWDVTKHQRDLILYEGTSTFDSSRAMSFSPDGKRIITRFWGNSANPAVWDTSTGKQLYHLNVVVNTITYSSDGRHFLTATTGGKAQVWDAESGQLLQTLWGHDTIVASVDGNSDCMEDTSVQWCGTRLVSGGVDGTIKVWDITPDGRGEGTILSGADFTIDQDWSHLTTLTTNINSLNVLTATFQRWNATGKERNQFSASDAFSSDWPASQAFFPYQIMFGHWLTFTPSGAINILDVTSQGKVSTSLCCFDTKSGNVPRYPIVSPDGKLLAFGNDSGTVELWDLVSRQPFKTLNVTNSGQKIKVMAFSPNSKQLATGFTDGGTIKIWDISTSQLRLTLSGQSRQQPSLVFSSDGKLIAAGSCDTSIFIWNATTGEKKFELHGHSACVNELVFSPNNALLASASPDHTTRIWDLKTGQELLTLPIGAATPRLAFSPDNSFLLASLAYDNSENYDTRIFLLNPDDLVTLAKSRLTRSLTTEECQQYLHVGTCPSQP